MGNHPLFVYVSNGRCLFNSVKDKTTFKFLRHTEIEQIHDPSIWMLCDEPVEAGSDNRICRVEPSHELVIIYNQDFLPIDFYRICIRIHVASSFFGSKRTTEKWIFERALQKIHQFCYINLRICYSFPGIGNPVSSILNESYRVLCLLDISCSIKAWCN